MDFLNVFSFSDAPLAQSDRASVFGTEGWGFESLKVRHGQSPNAHLIGLVLRFNPRTRRSHCTFNPCRKLGG